MSLPLFNIDVYGESGKVVSIPFDFVASESDYILNSTYNVRQYKCGTNGVFSGEYRDVQVTVKIGGGGRYYADKVTALNGGTIDWHK